LTAEIDRLHQACALFRKKPRLVTAVPFKQGSKRALGQDSYHL
jgi:hypothetical protein